MTAETLEYVENRLKQVKAEGNINITEHTFLRCQHRGIPVQDLINLLQNPEKLVGAEKENHFSSNRYGLLFKISNRRSLWIIVEFENKDLNIVTAYIEIKKWQRALEKWQKKQQI